MSYTLQFTKDALDNVEELKKGDKIALKKLSSLLQELIQTSENRDWATRRT